MAAGNIVFIDSESEDEEPDNIVVTEEIQQNLTKHTTHSQFQGTPKGQDTISDEHIGVLNLPNCNVIEAPIKYKTDYHCVLLKRFFEDIKVTNLKICIEGETKTITLRGPKELVVEHKIQILERINSICVCSESISESRNAILRRQGFIEELRKRARRFEEVCHIFIAEEESEVKNQLHCAAFSENDARAALLQTMASFDKVEISYSDQHLEMFSSNSWDKLTRDLQGSLMVVIEIVHSQGVVEVEGLDEHVTRAAAQVREMVKDHRCLQTWPITGAKARLISKVSYFQEEIRKTKEEAQQRQLTLGVERVEEVDSLTFKYTDDGFLKTRIQGVLDLVKSIQVTVSDICKTAHDQEVITRCLNSEKGKRELQALETKYKVFIDLVPGKNVEIKVVQDSDTGDALAERSTSMPDLHSTEEEPLVVGATKLVVKRGSLLRERASVLVNVLRKRSRWAGRLPKKFMHECKQIKEEFERNYDDEDNMVVTEVSGHFNRKCQYVCHIVLNDWVADGSREQELQKAVRACLGHCLEEGLDSIAFPAVGSGKLLKFPIQVVARVMLKECVDWLKSSRSGRTTPKKIVFVMYAEDEKRVFDEELNRHRGGSPRWITRMMSGLSKPFRRKSTKESEEPTGHTETFSGQHLEIFGESAQGLKDSKRKIVKEIEALFLAKEVIEHKGGGTLTGEEKEDILETARQLSVILKIDRDGYVVVGHKDDVQALANKIRSLLLNRVSTVSSGEHPRRQRWMGPRSRKGTLEYWNEVLKNSSTPLYWREFRGGHAIKPFLSNEENFCRVNLVSDETFRAISDLVEQTWDPSHVGHGKDATNLSHSGIQVKKIERVENIELFSKYSNQREEIIRRMLRSKQTSYPRLETLTKNGGILTTQKMSKLLNTSLYLDINEHYAFHGTKSSFIENITKKGIDPRKSSDRLLFGQGIYCAESSTKADQYTDGKDKRQTKGLKMLLVRLLIGNPFVSGEKKNYRHPPCSLCNTTECVNSEHASYDSIVVEGSWLFREFVVYETNHCYPEYIITYDRV